MKRLLAFGVAAVALATLLNAPSVMLGFTGHVQASMSASPVHTESTHSSVCC
jgi:hypothetical protein